MLILLIVILIILLTISLWHWFIYKAMALGLIYEAKINHCWNISNEEMKKITNNSINRIINDFFKS